MHGTTILWSNDGGIATYIATSFIYFILLIKEYKKDIKRIILYTFMYIGISLLSFLLLLTIITRGNILSWFEFTFGVSSYQKWYYTDAPSKVNMSIFQIDFSLYNVLMIIMVIYYIYKIFRAKKQNEVIRYALFDIIAIASIISMYLYQLLSGGYSKDMMNLVFLTWVLAQIVRIIINKVQEKKSYHFAKLVVTFTAFGVILSNMSGVLLAFNNRADNDDYVYIKELKGYFSTLGDSIEDAMERIGNEKIFSTYASAIDTATGQFQPTGIDYIIHCMGDKQREEYLEVFRKSDFKYVTTTDRNYSAFNGFEYWIKNANWFFYRELYQNYVPVFATEYNVFWEKRKKENSLPKVVQKAQIVTKQKKKDTYRIEIKTEDPNFNGVADVKVAYTSKKTKRFAKTGNINCYVYVNNVTEKSLAKKGYINYNIPNDSEGYYVPVVIANGKGVIELSSYPKRRYSY